MSGERTVVAGIETAELEQDYRFTLANERTYLRIDQDDENLDFAKEFGTADLKR